MRCGFSRGETLPPVRHPCRGAASHRCDFFAVLIPDLLQGRMQCLFCLCFRVENPPFSRREMFRLKNDVISVGKTLLADFLRRVVVGSRVRRNTLPVMFCRQLIVMRPLFLIIHPNCRDISIPGLGLRPDSPHQIHQASSGVDMEGRRRAFKFIKNCYHGAIKPFGGSCEVPEIPGHFEIDLYPVCGLPHSFRSPAAKGWGGLSLGTSTPHREYPVGCHSLFGE